ncbi:translocon-associated protein subunit beta [Plakobranchus ocellatus]|uniref:Translocon-associated protein subunit beta n=1 Tax=Plakobranchus ocellatus TaxID=259542 RepID=A0AAV4D1E7_9GAST|nr:translocon-associated protein subunit beta [Plakobranchus ocellatus]
MKLWWAALILSFGCFLPTFGEEESEARLLVSKNILNQYLVEGKDLTVEYKVFNVGGKVAFDVVLNDNSFPQSSFTPVSGSLKATWERITPNSNVTHAVILKPLKSGYFNFTSADVSYLTSEESKERTFGYSSFPGEGGIVPQREFDRRFSPHVLDWLVFAFMTLPSLGIPYLLWYSSKSKYDQPKPKKN